MATLNKLIEFTPNDDTEREIFESCKKDVLNEYLADTKSTWSKGTFYLGGFIKMKPDDEITLKNIDEVKIIRAKRVVSRAAAVLLPIPFASIKEYSGCSVRENDAAKIMGIQKGSAKASKAPTKRIT
jgi:hypothetical protein